MYCAPTRIFGMVDTSGISLSIVVPIGAMVGQLENLLSWIDTIQDYPAQVILVVDEKMTVRMQNLFERWSREVSSSLL